MDVSAVVDDTGQVELRTLLTCFLKKSESLLGGLLKSRYTLPSTKPKFNILLYEIKIRIARLYTLLKYIRTSDYCRIMNKKPNIRIQNNRNIRNIFKFLQQIYQTKKQIVVPQVTNNDKAESTKESNCFDGLALMLNSYYDSKISVKYYTTNIIKISRKTEYSIIIREKSNRILQLYKFDLFWPGGNNIDTKIYQKISKNIILYLKTPETAIKKIDKLLCDMHAVAILGYMAHFFNENQSYYQYSAIRIPNGVSINFGEQFGASGIFNVVVNDGKIVISSIVPIEWPPDSEYLTNVDFRKPGTQFLHFSADLESNIDLDCVLGYLKNIAIYSKLKQLWKQVDRAIAYTGGSFLKTRFEFYGRYSTFSQIDISTRAAYCIIRVDSEVGEVLVNFNGTMRKFESVNTIIKHLGIAALERHLGGHSRVDYRMYDLTHGKKVAYRISFAPDFTILYHSDNGFPNLRVCSLEGRIIESPSTVALRHMRYRDAWIALSNIIISLRDFVFALQLERLLKNANFPLSRAGTKISVVASGMGIAEFNVSGGLWSLKFIPDTMFLPKLMTSIIVVTQNWYTVRGPAFALNIFVGLHDFLDIISHFTFTAYRSKFINNIVLTAGILSARFSLPDGSFRTLSFNYMQNFSICGITERQMVLQVLPTYTQPRARFLCVPQADLVIRSFFLSISPALSLAAFFSHTAITILEIIKTFRSPPWALILSNRREFKAIYRRKYTLSFEVVQQSAVQIKIPITSTSSVLLASVESCDPSSKLVSPDGSITRFWFFGRDFLKVADAIDNFFKARAIAAATGLALIRSERESMTFDDGAVTLDVSSGGSRISLHSRPDLDSAIARLPQVPSLVLLLRGAIAGQCSESLEGALNVIAAVAEMSGPRAADEAIRTATFANGGIRLIVGGQRISVTGLDVKNGGFVFCGDTVEGTVEMLRSLNF